MSEDHFLQSDDFKQICKIIMSKDYEILQVAALLILITEKSLNEKSLSAFVRQILRYFQTFSDENKIYELYEGEILEYSICPEQFGFKRAFHSEIIGSNAYENAKDLKNILSGKMQGAKFDLVILNAMFALYTANKASSPLAAKDMILEAIYSGKVIEYFKEYQAYAKA